MGLMVLHQGNLPYHTSYQTIIIKMLNFGTTEACSLWVCCLLIIARKGTAPEDPNQVM